MYFYGFDQTYIYLIIPALIISMYAQFKVTSTFSKYKNVRNARGLTASQVCRTILDRHGLRDVKIEHIAGNLTDHYDPKARVVRLSDATYSSTSVASIGVAAHETGHAIQHSTAYAPLVLRNNIYPVVNISSTLAIPLAILGFLLGFQSLVSFGIILFMAVVAFQLITLPVEFNASLRATRILVENGILDDEEIRPVKKVLSAAAFTYVASAIVAVANLLRLIILANNRRD